MASLSQSPQYEPPQESLPAGQEAQFLIALLDEARAYTLAEFGGADPTLVVHAGSGWTVRDVAGHILAWENVALQAVQALESGAPAYTIPDFVSFDAMNARLREQQRAQVAILHPCSRRGGDDRLGAERHAQPGRAQHVEIVGAIANRERVREIEPPFGGKVGQGREFGVPIEDRFGHLPGQYRAIIQQGVRTVLVKATQGCHTAGEKAEPA